MHVKVREECSSSKQKTIEIDVPKVIKEREGGISIDHHRRFIPPRPQAPDLGPGLVHTWQTLQLINK